MSELAVQTGPAQAGPAPLIAPSPAKACPALAYRPEIDGLRALAVLPVLFTHAGFAGLGGGHLGVDVFFVISGYLITAILLRELDREGRVSIIDFYERRARRILPVLFVVVAASFVAAWIVMLPKEFRDFGQSMVATGSFLSNVFFASENGYFLRASDFKPLLHTWSLSVEEQFYLVFPLLLAGLAWLAPGRVAMVLAALALASFGWALHGTGVAPDSNFFMPLGRGWELLAGAMLACWGGAAEWRSRRPAWLLDALSMAGLVAILAAYLLWDDTTPNPGLPTLLPVLGACAIIAFAAPGTLAYRLLTLRAMVGVGLVSYSAYLWHQPLFVFTRLLVGDLPGWGWGAMIAATLLIAWASWAVIEAPFRDRARIGRGAVFGFGGAGLAAMIAAGMAVHLQGGLPGRLDERRLLLASAQTDVSPYRDSCGNSLPESFDGYCVFGETAGPTVAFIGDSHGKELFWRASERAEEEGFAVQAFLWNACLPVALPEDARGCAEFVVQAREHIIASPEIEIVVISANWSRYLGCGDLCYGEDYGPMPAARVAAIGAALRREIAAYAEAGKSVLLVSQIPTMPWDIPRHLNARALRDGGIAEIGVAIDSHLERAAVAIDTVEPLEALPGVEVLRPRRALCADGRCPALRGDRPLYFDDNHLNGHGAEALLSMLMPRLDAMIEG